VLLAKLAMFAVSVFALCQAVRDSKRLVGPV
jgi:hypothetical protein